MEELLEGVQQDIGDPDASYKLRSARQLLSVSTSQSILG
jgi:hypothetical protein